MTAKARAKANQERIAARAARRRPGQWCRENPGDAVIVVVVVVVVVAMVLPWATEFAGLGGRRPIGDRSSTQGRSVYMSSVILHYQCTCLV